MENYFKFKDTFVFNESGQLCQLLGENEKIYGEDLFRGDGVKTTYKIDLFTGDINEVFVSFDGTYIKNMEVKRKVGDVCDVEVINDDEARKTIKENNLTVSYLLKKNGGTNIEIEKEIKIEKNKCSDCREHGSEICVCDIPF